MILDSEPDAVAYDSGNGNIYVANLAGANVTVISGSTGKTVGSVPVGLAPDGIAYDNRSGNLYVANLLSDNVTIISGSTNEPIGSVTICPAQVGCYGSRATAVSYDSRTDAIYVASWDSRDVSIISGRNNTLIATVHVIGYIGGLAYDPEGGAMIAPWIGGINVISDTNYSVTFYCIPNQGPNSCSSSLAKRPWGVAYDSGKGELYVTDWTGEKVWVLSASTFDTLTSISLNYDPGGIAYDRVDGEVFVAPRAGPVPYPAMAPGGPDSIWVIDDRTNRVVKSVTVGADPLALAYDSGNDNVYVANVVSDTVSAVSGSTNKLVSTISVGNGGGGLPGGMAYDWGNGDLYVADSETETVAVISASSNSVIASIPLGPQGFGASQIAYDSRNGNLYVTTAECDVLVVSGSTDAVVATIPVLCQPSGVAYDNANGNIYVSSPRDVQVISGSTNKVVTTVPITVGTGSCGPVWTTMVEVYDNRTGNVYVGTTWVDPTCPLVGANVTVISGATNAVVANVSSVGATLGMAYDPRTGNIYLSQVEGTVSVVSGVANKVIANLPIPGSAGAISYDSGDGDIYVWGVFARTVTVVSDATNTVVATMQIPSPVPTEQTGISLLAAAYDSRNGNVYVTDPYSNSVSHLSTGPYAVQFKETGLPPGFSWSVTLSALTGSSTSAGIPFSVPNGTYSFTVGTMSGYTASPASGSVTVNGASVGTSVTFTATPPPTYQVSFTETGLPSGTSWSVTLGGTTLTSTTGTITFTEADGTYAYTIGAVPGYSTPASGGSIDVHGIGVTQTVAWTQVTYPVTFEESALPAGASWSVSVQGTAQSSTTTKVVFNEPNGTYSYAVSPVTGYTATPSSGTITVNGESVTQTITFSVVPSAPTISSFSASASAITIGSSVTFTVTAAGGEGALAYAYAGLPSGCSSANASTLTCTPTATGSFTVKVTVTDAAGRSTSATVTLTVNPPGATVGGPSGNTILGLPALEGYAIFAAIAIAIVVAGTVAVVRSKRRRMMRPPSPPPSSPPP